MKGVRADKDQRRERRGQPAGMATRIWVCRQAAFYKENPQLLKVDVSRRRVYMRDVWAIRPSATSGESEAMKG